MKTVNLKTLPFLKRKLKTLYVRSTLGNIFDSILPSMFTRELNKTEMHIIITVLQKIVSSIIEGLDTCVNISQIEIYNFRKSVILLPEGIFKRLF